MILFCLQVIFGFAIILAVASSRKLQAVGSLLIVFSVGFVVCGIKNGCNTDSVVFNSFSTCHR